MSSLKNHPVRVQSVSFRRKRHYLLPKPAVEGIDRAAATTRVNYSIIHCMQAVTDDIGMKLKKYTTAYVIQSARLEDAMITEVTRQRQK